MSEYCRRLTCRGDLSSVVYDNIKYVPNCDIAIVEVVRSTDGRLGISSQTRGGKGTDLPQQGFANGEISGRNDVFVNPIDRNVVSLRGLQNETHELVNKTIHKPAPSLREVQTGFISQPVVESMIKLREAEVRNRTLQETRDYGNWNSIAIELERQLKR